MAALKILTGPLRNKLFKLEKNTFPFTIGRDSNRTEICLQDLSVSRRHASISYRDHQWFICDMDSSNGTYLNETLISHPLPLRHNDQIRCGNTVILFEAESNIRLDSSSAKSSRTIELTFDPGETVVGVVMNAKSGCDYAKTSLSSNPASSTDQHQPALTIPPHGKTNEESAFSHAVRNIIQSVTAGSDVLEMSLENGNTENALRAWKLLKRSIAKIETMLQEVISLTSLSSPVFGPCSFNKLIESIVESVKPQAGDRGIAVSINTDETIDQVNLDTNQIQQAVELLVQNAVEASELNKGLVTISTELDCLNEEIILAINNNNTKIDSVKSFYESFYNNKNPNTGVLGFPIARKIVKQHFGKININTKPTQGPTLTVHLPTGLKDNSCRNDEPTDQTNPAGNNANPEKTA